MPAARAPHRGEQLWGGDGGAVPVEFDAAAQIEVADLDGGDLGGVGRGGEAGVPANPAPAAGNAAPRVLPGWGARRGCFLALGPYGRCLR